MQNGRAQFAYSYDQEESRDDYLITEHCAGSNASRHDRW
jgi:hypothetical protein